MITMQVNTSTVPETPLFWGCLFSVMCVCQTTDQTNVAADELPNKNKIMMTFKVIQSKQLPDRLCPCKLIFRQPRGSCRDTQTQECTVLQSLGHCNCLDHKC